MNFRRLISQKLSILLITSIVLLSVLVVVRMMTLEPPKKEDTKIVEQTQVQETTVEEMTTDVIDYSIYDQELMATNGIEKMNFDDYQSVQEVIDDVVADFQVATDNISIAYYNFINEETYSINSATYRVAASTCKLPYSVLFFDLLDQGAVELGTQIPYYDSYYAEGNGNITNGVKKSTYDLSYVLYDLLVNSDNTSAVMLYQYYEQMFGDVETTMAQNAGMSDMPGNYYYSNILSADFLMNTLKKVATEPKYAVLVKTMMEDKKRELFISYVPKGMANKFGRYNNAINDTGIYYENDQAQYALVCLTENVWNDAFLEALNLRVNEWHHYQQSENFKAKQPDIETNHGESN